MLKRVKGREKTGKKKISLAYDASTDWESRLTITRGTKTGKK
jgi:hypothetical protein